MSARLTPLLVAGAVAVTILASGSTATADGIGFAVSSDGVTWSSALAAPLFDGSLRWVPGDAHVGSFYVRNDSGREVTVRLEARDAGTRLLTTQGDVRLYARTDGGAWHLVPVGVPSARLDRAGLPLGQVSRIDVRAVFDPASPNRSQSQDTTLSFVIRLADADPRADGGPGDLAGTGAPGVRLPVLAGALLLGCGVALVRRRREVRHG